MIAHSASVAQYFADPEYDGGFPSLDAVRYCFLHVALYREHITAGDHLINHSMVTQTVDARDSIDWLYLWKTISSAVRRYSRDEKWGATYIKQYWHLPLSVLTPEELLAKDRAFAGECLEIMNSIDGKGNGDRLGRPKRKPVFPDELVAALGLFILPEDVSKYPRLARLQDKEQAIHAKIESTAQGHPQGMDKVEGVEGTVRGADPNEGSGGARDKLRGAMRRSNLEKVAEDTGSQLPEGGTSW